MLQEARNFFAERDVLEVETPCLSRSAVSDPNIESVSARLELEHGSDFFLRTSPEFAMKRLLCDGYPDIFEIGRVFRDGEAGPRHQPEFTLVEWYRLGFGLAQIIDDTVDFLRAMLERKRLRGAAQQLSYDEAFEEYAGLSPGKADVAELAAAAGADRDLRRSLGDNRDAWLDLLLAERICPGFPANRLTVVRHYPATQAALARICPDDPRLADRFEVFFGSLELANGFVECRDAAEQRRRFERDQRLRGERNAVRRPLDEQFLAALEQGLPECAGVAVGLDRLLMINAGVSDIRRVQSIAFQRSHHD